MYGANQHVQSLTTLSSPHLGLKMMDNWLREPKERIEHLDRVFIATGVTKENVEEFITPNMEAFNEMALDQPDVKYFSMGSQKDPNRVGHVLKTGSQIIKRG